MISIKNKDSFLKSYYDHIDLEVERKTLMNVMDTSPGASPYVNITDIPKLNENSQKMGEVKRRIREETTFWGYLLFLFLPANYFYEKVIKPLEKEIENTSF